MMSLTVIMPALVVAEEPVVPERMRIEASIVAKLEPPSDSSMHMPTDVAVDGAGRVFVADGVNDRIVQFDADGQFVESLNALGDDKLSRPIGLFCDSEDRLWIADTGNARLIVRDREGKRVQTLTPPKVQDAKHELDLTDVAVSADGTRVCVIDNDAHRLLTYDTKTEQWQPFGQQGGSIGEFSWPFMIDFDGDGMAYISEAIGARIQRFTADNRWAGQISRWGVEPGMVYRPKGVVAVEDRVLISDSTLHAVQVFSTTGRFLGVLSNPDGTVLRLVYPMGMDVGPDERLYVVESRENRVAVITLSSRKQSDAEK
jgi:DNA-binding beta-propeller fold protein YncE